MTAVENTSRSALPGPLLLPRDFLVVGVGALSLAIALLAGDLWVLNFVHVLAGVMWTGIDLFMGFFAGPAIRRLDLEHRRAMIMRLMPRMLLLMPTLAIVTSTAGWYLSVERGYLDLEYPELWWFIAALAIVTVLTVQGIGILLPTNLRVLLEIRKEDPDFSRVGRLMRFYVWLIASQGVMQVAIIMVMARFVTGL